MARVYYFIIAFDISCNKRRYRVRKLLKQWGIMSQKSIYETSLAPDAVEELFLQLMEKISTKTDRLLIFPVSPFRKPEFRAFGDKTTLSCRFLGVQ